MDENGELVSINKKKLKYPVALSSGSSSDSLNLRKEGMLARALMITSLTSFLIYSLSNCC